MRRHPSWALGDRDRYRCQGPEDFAGDTESKVRSEKHFDTNAAPGGSVDAPTFRRKVETIAPAPKLA